MKYSSKILLKMKKVLIILTLIVCYQSNAQEVLKFSNMLLKKADVDLFINSKTSLGKLVFVPTNSATKDINRRIFELSVYAYTDQGVLIAPYNPMKLTSSTTDSSYSKDILLGTYSMTKTTLLSLIPTVTYSFLRFKPFNSRTDASLTNFISYKVFAVAADGITPVTKDGKTTSLVTTLDLNPSPPR